MKFYWPITMDFESAIENLEINQPLSPFHEEVLEFTHALSKRLIRMRHLPEVVALGYWLRKTNIQKMKLNWEGENKGKYQKARGTVFHIAPSNVDTIFVYSWMLSLLGGNRNIIRVSSKEQSNELLNAILVELSLNEFESIANRTIICTYSHEEDMTERISEICHTRVIWGGDNTVKTIRRIPLNPMANELAFPDRFSLAVLSAKTVMTMNDNHLDELLEKFYNDVFWFDQMACSSPRLVVWSGDQAEDAKYRFWAAFEQKVKQKQYDIMAATQVLKYTTSLWMAADKKVEKIDNRVYFSRIQLTNVSSEVRERHCGGGLFFEVSINTFKELADFVIDKDQTLAYFGFEQSELLDLIDHISSRGIDRIVPIGQALNFDGIWDGQSFLKSFTREVVIK